MWGIGKNTAQGMYDFLQKMGPTQPDPGLGSIEAQEQRQREQEMEQRIMERMAQRDQQQQQPAPVAPAPAPAPVIPDQVPQNIPQTITPPTPMPEAAPQQPLPLGQPRSLAGVQQPQPYQPWWQQPLTQETSQPAINALRGNSDINSPFA